MRTDASLAGHRMGELRYVTEHYRDLLGLRFLPAFCLWLVLEASGAHRDRPALDALALFLVWVGVACACGWLIARWQERRFGVLVGEKIPNVADGPPLQTLIFVTVGLFCIAGLSMAPKGHANLFSLLLPASTLMLPRCFDASASSLAIQSRRLLYAGVFIALCAAGLADLCGWRPTAAANLLVPALGMLLITYDHWLLERFLGPVHDRESAHAD